MKKIFVQFVAILMALTILPTSSVLAARNRDRDDEESNLIRVGLYYGSNALPGANLQNYVGEGFQFGYMDDDEFCWVGETEETAISMVKSQNVYYSDTLPEGGYGYSDKIETDIVVGCYHLRLDESFDDFEEALEAAEDTDGFPAWIDGEYEVRIGAYTSKKSAEKAARKIDEDVTVVGTSSYGITVVETGSDQPLFQFDDRDALVVRPGLDDDEPAITHFKGYRYYGDFSYERIDGDNLTVVSLVDLEDYVRGILPYEMNNAWPIEALKAQAVCARSYTMTNLGRHSNYNFDICNTTHCQVYYGVNKANDLTDEAVDDTAGEMAWYDGEIIEAYYHSSDGGATEDIENVWYEEIPYLRGVEDIYEPLVEDEIPQYRWTKTYTGEELQDRLNDLELSGVDFEFGEIVDVRVTETTDMGNVYSVTITDENGEEYTVYKDSVRTVLGARSLRFTISGGGDGYSLTNDEYISRLEKAWVLSEDGELERLEDGPFYALTADGTEKVTAPENSDGTFVLSGAGHGHNLGLSQWGAYAMAMEGYDYIDILEFYYTGIEIE